MGTREYSDFRVGYLDAQAMEIQLDWYVQFEAEGRHQRPRNVCLGAMHWHGRLALWRVRTLCLRDREFF